MDGGHREHISQARDLLELAAQTPEGRRDLRGWLGLVLESLGREDGQDVPASQDDRTTWSRRALARTGYEVALSADELDDADVVAATMELAARTGGRASFGDDFVKVDWGTARLLSTISSRPLVP